MNVQREAALRALLPRIQCQFHGQLFAFVATKCESGHVEVHITRLIVWFVLNNGAIVPFSKCHGCKNFRCEAMP